MTEKARWNRAVCGGIHRGRRSGMGRIAKSPMARRYMDQAVKMKFSYQTGMESVLAGNGAKSTAGRS